MLPVAQSPVSCAMSPKVYWIGVMPELLAFHVYPKLTGCTGVEYSSHIMHSLDRMNLVQCIQYIRLPEQLPVALNRQLPVAVLTRFSFM